MMAIERNCVSSETTAALPTAGSQLRADEAVRVVLIRGDLASA